MNTEKIGKFIASIRKDKNMTQKELADKLNITDSAISRWERGVGCPDISLINDLSEILGVSINEILVGEKISKMTKEKADQITKEIVPFYQRKYFKNKTIKYILIIVILVVALLILFTITDSFRTASGKNPIFIYSKASVGPIFNEYEDGTREIINEKSTTYFGIGYTVTKCEKEDYLPYYVFEIGFEPKHICFHGGWESPYR